MEHISEIEMNSGNEVGSMDVQSSTPYNSLPKQNICLPFSTPLR